jgi:hypothetical protein
LRRWKFIFQMEIYIYIYIYTHSRGLPAVFLKNSNYVFIISK